jgi:glyoxylase-like metal-dependent hydrolase (beta-lactamase superfamily II)
MNATDDWYEVDALSADDHRITEGRIFGSFLLAGEERALLLDAGAGIGDLEGLATDLVDVPVTLLVTHAHWDHIGAAAQFDSVVADERELDEQGRVSSADLGDGGGYGPADFVADWREAGGDFPDGFDPGGFELEPAEDPDTVAPGETLDLGGRTVELVGLPGHSPGQLGVLDREAGVLYGADVLHREHGLYIHFRGCDIHDYVDTFEYLRSLRDEGAFDELHVSHASPITGGDLSVLDDYREGLHAILDDDLEYEMAEDGAARQYEVAGAPVLTKPDVV